MPSSVDRRAFLRRVVMAAGWALAVPLAAACGPPAVPPEASKGKPAEPAKPPEAAKPAAPVAPPAAPEA